MSVTIHDLARLAGLNSSTISRALRNDPRVRKDTREKIHALAKVHGYIPNLNARNLADGKTRMLAFLMGSLDFQLEREAAVTLNEIFSQHGYTLMIFSYAPDPGRFYADRLQKFTQKICDGAIIIAPSYKEHNGILPILNAVKMPLVCLDRWFNRFPLPTVTTDNAIAISQLCQSALQAGMDGAVIDFAEVDTVAESRRKETIRILEENNIPYTFSANGSIPEFLQKNNIRKTALFVNSCLSHPEWAKVLPKGFITAAFDRDYLQSERHGPIFLCIQDSRQLAANAAKLLLEHLDGKSTDTPILQMPPLEIISII